MERMCYWIPYVPNGREAGGDADHYFPGIVKPDESGYYLTNWDWGTDREIAVKCAADLNAKLGVTGEQAFEMVTQSMAKSWGECRR
jgi:hypothetical protein